MAKDQIQRLVPLLSNPVTLVRLQNLSRVHDGFSVFQVLGLAWRHKMETAGTQGCVHPCFTSTNWASSLALVPVKLPEPPGFETK